MDPKIEVGDGLCKCWLGDTLVVLWREPATEARWRWVMGDVEARAKAEPAGVILFKVILATSSPPGSELRAQMQAAFRRLGPGLRRLTVVPLGESLWLSIVRSIVRGVLLVSGQSNRHVVASRMNEGLDAVLAVAGPNTPSRVDLVRAINEISDVLGVQRLDAA